MSPFWRQVTAQTDCAGRLMVWCSSPPRQTRTVRSSPAETRSEPFGSTATLGGQITVTLRGTSRKESCD